MDFKHTDVTELIIKAFYKVYGTLGYGFLEKVYGNAMAIELQKLGLNVVQEARITVFYEQEIVGEYFADLLVADAVIVELKAVKRLMEEHEASCSITSRLHPMRLVCCSTLVPNPRSNARHSIIFVKVQWTGSKDQLSEKPKNLRNLRSSASEKRSCYT